MLEELDHDPVEASRVPGLQIFGPDAQIVPDHLFSRHPLIGGDGVGDHHVSFLLPGPQAGRAEDRGRRSMAANRVTVAGS